MVTLFRVGPVLFLFLFPGCSGSLEQSGDPKAVEVLLAHWGALQRREWGAAYDQLHPDLKTAGLTLKLFTEFQARRLKSGGFPQDIKIAGSEQTGDDVVVSFDVLYVPPGGGVALAVPPLRKATLRKSGDTWRLATHDLFAARP